MRNMRKRAGGGTVALLLCSVLQGCASSSSSTSTRRSSEAAPEVAGQTFSFSANVAHLGSSRIFEGKVTFLDHNWYIMEMDQRPCSTRTMRYSPRAHQIRVFCEETGVFLTLEMAQGMIVGQVDGPVPWFRMRRICADMRFEQGVQRCFRWGEVREETNIRASGRARVVRVTGRND